MRLVAVAVPAPLRRLFDYAAGDAQAPGLLPGMRVRVPFGRRDVVGFVAQAPREEAQPAHACKPIGEILDAEPLLPAELLDLCRWVADYYHHPLGEVIAAALPGPLRRGAASTTGMAVALRITAAGIAARAALPARARLLGSLLARLEAAPETRASLARALPRSAAALRTAIGRGWLETCVPPPAPATTAVMETAPALTAEQGAALAQLRGMPAGFSAALVEGVTGSGKTELYLQLAADALAAGGQVLVLAPEIGLTPQLAQRFTRRFGARVASYHSGLGEAERARVWRRAKDGELSIIVGTRSAVFLPLAAPRLIVIDEEHDVSYKQQDSLRYNARDVALLRAQRLGIPAVLGSATPALESQHNAAAGRFVHLQLHTRVHAAAPPPRVTVVDVRGHKLEHGLSTPLLDAVERHVGGDGQALLFLNRRGYAPTLLCRNCGWVARCPHCDARMVLHRGRSRLLCHHCGQQAPVPQECPDCGERELLPLGQGTERIEDALRLRFPQQRVERFDSDRFARAGELGRLLEDVRERRVNILVGTQVLAKGHDFAGLSLAGIVDVDQALFGSDFRALERMGQMVTQVAGRVGRAGQAGEVLLQTLQPEHPLLRLLIERGYPAFSRALLEERSTYGLPPFAHLALLRAEAPREGAAMDFLREAAGVFPAAAGVDLLGPAPAAMERRGGLHRAQLLLRTTARAALHRSLAAWMPRLEELRKAARLRWSLDVDPADLF
jgi:primosomal protein N' (replication factor Y)